jgi:hypothetical protein
MSNQLCETRKALMLQLSKNSNEVVTVASQLATLAALDGAATLDEKVDISNNRTRLKALMRESDEVHERLNAHRSEHGC